MWCIMRWDEWWVSEMCCGVKLRLHRLWERREWWRRSEYHLVGMIVYLSKDKQEVTIGESGSWMVLDEVFLENFMLWNNPRPSLFISMCSRILNVQFFGAFRRFKMICLCHLKLNPPIFILLIGQQCDFGEHLQISAGNFIHPSSKLFTLTTQSHRRMKFILSTAPSVWEYGAVGSENRTECLRYIFSEGAPKHADPSKIRKCDTEPLAQNITPLSSENSPTEGTDLSSQPIIRRVDTLVPRRLLTKRGAPITPPRTETHITRFSIGLAPSASSTELINKLRK